ncbi:MAG: alpha/beta hydrolase [Pseudomonadota bacterium]
MGTLITMAIAMLAVFSAAGVTFILLQAVRRLESRSDLSGRAASIYDIDEDNYGDWPRWLTVSRIAIFVIIFGAIAAATFWYFNEREGEPLFTINKPQAAKETGNADEDAKSAVPPKTPISAPEAVKEVTDESKYVEAARLLRESGDEAVTYRKISALSLEATRDGDLDSFITLAKYEENAQRLREAELLYSLAIINGSTYAITLRDELRETLAEKTAIDDGVDIDAHDATLKSVLELYGPYGLTILGQLYLADEAPEFAKMALFYEADRGWRETDSENTDPYRLLFYRYPDVDRNPLSISAFPDYKTAFMHFVAANLCTPGAGADGWLSVTGAKLETLEGEREKLAANASSFLVRLAEKLTPQRPANPEAYCSFEYQTSTFLKLSEAYAARISNPDADDKRYSPPLISDLLREIAKINDPSRYKVCEFGNGELFLKTAECPAEPKQVCWNGDAIPQSQTCPDEPVVVCWDAQEYPAAIGCPDEPTQMCWNDEEMPLTKGCPAERYKSCPYGGDVLENATCPQPEIRCWNDEYVYEQHQCPREPTPIENETTARLNSPEAKDRQADYVLEEKIDANKPLEVLSDSANDQTFLGFIEEAYLDRRTEAALHYALAVNANDYDRSLYGRNAKYSARPVANSSADCARQISRQENAETPPQLDRTCDPNSRLYGLLLNDEEKADAFDLFRRVHELIGAEGLYEFGLNALSGAEFARIAGYVTREEIAHRPVDGIWPEAVDRRREAVIYFDMAEQCGLPEAAAWRSAAIRNFEIDPETARAYHFTAKDRLRELAKDYGVGSRRDRLQNYCKAMDLNARLDKVKADLELGDRGLPQPKADNQYSNPDNVPCHGDDYLLGLCRRNARDGGFGAALTLYYRDRDYGFAGEGPQASVEDTPGIHDALIAQTETYNEQFDEDTDQTVRPRPGPDGVFPDTAGDDVDDRDGDSATIGDIFTNDRSDRPAAEPTSPVDPDIVEAVEKCRAETAPRGKRCRVINVLYGSSRKISYGKPLETMNRVGEVLETPFTTELSPSLNLGQISVVVPDPINRERDDINRQWEITIPFTSISIRGKLDPTKQFVLYRYGPLDHDEFANALASERTAFVYVHGYNEPMKNAAMKAAQIAADIKGAPKPIIYSWPTLHSFDQFKDPTQYQPSRLNAEASRLQFIQFLELIRKETNVEQVHIIAHSMGNYLMLDALADHYRNQPLPEQTNFFGELIMAAPDVEADDFKKIVADLEPIFDHQTLYVSDKDLAMGISRWGVCIPRGTDECGVRAGYTPGPPAAPSALGATHDTIDVSRLKEWFFDISGHNYVPATRLLEDIAGLIVDREHDPERRHRARIEGLGEPDERHWFFYGD